MLPIRKHLRCSWLVPDQGVGLGARLGLSPGPPRPALPSPCPRQGPGAHGGGSGCWSPQRWRWGCRGTGKGHEAGSPGGAICLVLPPAACQL